MIETDNPDGPGRVVGHEFDHTISDASFDCLRASLGDFEGPFEAPIVNVDRDDLVLVRIHMGPQVKLVPDSNNIVGHHTPPQRSTARSSLERSADGHIADKWPSQASQPDRRTAP